MYNRFIDVYSAVPQPFFSGRGYIICLLGHQLSAYYNKINWFI